MKSGLVLVCDAWVEPPEIGTKRKKKGDSLDYLPEDVKTRLMSLGAASYQEDLNNEKVEEVPQDSVPDGGEAVPEKEEVIELPRKTASMAKWRDVAKRLSIPTSGMKKQEIIAACYKKTGNQ